LLVTVFKLTQRANARRCIIDVSGRSADNGTHVDPSSNLDVYPVGGGSAFTNDADHDVCLFDDVYGQLLP
jgi:hypothetical protein